MNVEDVDSVEEPGGWKRVPPQSSGLGNWPSVWLYSNSERVHNLMLNAIGLSIEQ